MKSKTIAILTLAAALMTPGTALAGTWVDPYEDGKTWQYQRDDGTMEENAWVESGGKWYYIGDYGYMYRCMVTPDGYMVGVDGAWTGQMMSLESGMDSDRAEAYENILLSAQKLEDYTLFDLDKDGAPELFVRKGTSEADYTWHVYTYNGSRAVAAGSFHGGHGGLCVDSEGNLYKERAHMGVYGLQAVSWKAGRAVCSDDFTCMEEMADDYERVMAEYGVYGIGVYLEGDFTPFY